MNDKKKLIFGILGLFLIIGLLTNPPQNNAQEFIESSDYNTNMDSPQIQDMHEIIETSSKSPIQFHTPTEVYTLYEEYAYEIRNNKPIQFLDQSSLTIDDVLLVAEQSYDVLNQLNNISETFSLLHQIVTLDDLTHNTSKPTTVEAIAYLWTQSEQELNSFTLPQLYQCLYLSYYLELISFEQLELQTTNKVAAAFYGIFQDSIQQQNPDYHEALKASLPMNIESYFDTIEKNKSSLEKELIFFLS